MAEETVSLKLVIEAANSAQTMGEVKKALTDINKELQNVKVGSKEFQDLTIAAGKLKGEMMDTKNQIKALDPDQRIKAIGSVVGTMANGFSAATSAAALFGTKNEELLETLTKVQAAASFANAIGSLQGFTDQFRVLGAVLKANPILMIASVLTGIGVALFALKDKIQVVGDAFNWMGEKLKDLGEFTGLYSREVEGLEKSLEKLNEEQAKTNKLFDNQIALAKSLGKETYGLQKVQLQYNAKVLQDKIDTHKKLNDLSAVEMQKLKDDLAANQLQQQILYNEYATRLAETLSKKVDTTKQVKEQYKLINDEIVTISNGTTDALEQNNIKQMQISIVTADQFELDGKRMLKNMLTYEDVRKQLVADSMTTIASLGQIFINNAKRLEKFNKGIAVTDLAINSAMAIGKAVQASAGIPFPANLPAIATAVAAVTANIAKAKALLQKAGTTSGETLTIPNTGGGGGGGSLPIPQLNPIQPTSTLINPDGTVNVQGKREAPIKVYVTETDITDTQNRVNSINKKAKIN